MDIQKHHLRNVGPWARGEAKLLLARVGVAATSCGSTLQLQAVGSSNQWFGVQTQSLRQEDLQVHL